MTIKRQDDTIAEQDQWPVLQSIAARQAERPAPLSTAEKEARWQIQSSSTSQQLQKPPSHIPEKAHQIASQLRHLAPSANNMNHKQASVQTDQPDSVSAVFQRLAKGEHKSPTQAGESRLIGQVFKR
ncbi:hypothetical protein ACO0LC_28200 [Undibacterium sp. JH2W]|uniref:hypothetical protein n=1 Tax=Undibacterium sp. JH2W TaxID=3413037 RepID=UPI003BF3492E